MTPEEVQALAEKAQEIKAAEGVPLMEAINKALDEKDDS